VLLSTTLISQANVVSLITFFFLFCHLLIFLSLLATSGFGEFLNLFLKDAGVDFEYVRFEYANWDHDKADFAKDKNLLNLTLPVVEVDGKYINKTVPVMRYLSKKLGKYINYYSFMQR
jgi:hypothetical protein